MYKIIKYQMNSSFIHHKTWSFLDITKCVDTAVIIFGLPSNMRKKFK